MTVNEMREWLADKPGDSKIMGGPYGKELAWYDIGLQHKEKTRVDPNGEQGELFNDPQ